MSDAVVPAPVERPEPPPAADEKEMLAAFLDYHRATLLWKCEGLTAEQLKQRSVPPSTLSLLGLVRHLTDVERGWFRRGVGGEGDKAPPLFDYDADPEADFDQADAADAADTIEAYRAEIELCRQAVARADSLDAPIGRREGRDGPTVRWVLCHMLEEYARHNGHADLLRQAIDGATGE